MAEVNPDAKRIIPPLSFHEAKLDPAGRLKLPTAFKDFFTALGIKDFFITSLDHELAQIYTIDGWLQRVSELNTCPDSETSANALFIAMKLGGEAGMDGQGRLLMPEKLRRALEIENQTVHLKAAGTSGTRVDIMSDRVFAEYDHKAMAAAPGITPALGKVGIR